MENALTVVRVWILTATLIIGSPGVVFAAGHHGMSEGCSAARLGTQVPVQKGLPAKVAATRKAIVAAAVRCDYAALQKLSQQGSQPFTYSFGDPGDARTYWGQQEENGEHPLMALVKLLRMPHGSMSGGLQYSWPSAYDDHPRAADWSALGTLYSGEAIAHFKQVGYLGYRVGISQTGDWLYFVQGD